MGTTVNLYASARYGYAGKQYIARISGRDSKFTFKREFIGKKGGKRGEDTSAMVDEPGLYERRDVDSKGRPDDSFLFVWIDGEEARTWPLTKEEAMKYAKRLDAGDHPNDLAREDIILFMRERIADEKKQDQEEMVTLRASTAALLGLEPSEKHRREEVTAARRELLKRLDVTYADEVRAELSEIKTEHLIEEIERRGFKVTKPREKKVEATDEAVTS